METASARPQGSQLHLPFCTADQTHQYHKHGKKQRHYATTQEVRLVRQKRCLLQAIHRGTTVDARGLHIFQRSLRCSRGKPAIVCITLPFMIKDHERRDGKYREQAKLITILQKAIVHSPVPRMGISFPLGKNSRRGGSADCRAHKAAMGTEPG